MIKKQNVGNAGEYYLAARLSALDFTVTITLGRAEKYDILALSPSGRLIKISVKTTQRPDAKSFPMSSKDETGASDDFYYAFIRFNDFSEEPDFWIVPSLEFCPILREGHQEWLDTPGKDGQKHKTTSMRQFNVELNDNKKKTHPKWQKVLDKNYKNLEQLIIN
jgi:hypothetical protein